MYSIYIILVDKASKALYIEEHVLHTEATELHASLLGATSFPHAQVIYGMAWPVTYMYIHIQ